MFFLMSFMKIDAYLPQLKELAEESSKKAFAPYSNFHVGAALLMKSGHIYTGCNVEFSDFLALHAEVNAIGSAINAGENDFQVVVVFSTSSPPVLPCGSCRQKLYEFSLLHKHDIRVIAFNDKKEEIVANLSELLPGGEIPVNKK
jgi:cytidine deaminase